MVFVSKKREVIENMKAVTEMGWDISGNSVVQCNVMLVHAWVKRIQELKGAGRIKSEKLRKQHYKE